MVQTTRRLETKGTIAVSRPTKFTPDCVAKHKVAQNAKKLNKGPAYMDRGLIFAQADGAAWKPTSISTLFHSITKRAGIGHLRFHDLRHTAASLMLERGVPITTVAEMLGHSSSATTMAVYAHAIKGEPRTRRECYGLDSTGTARKRIKPAL
jgi:integrase